MPLTPLSLSAEHSGLRSANSKHFLRGVNEKGIPVLEIQAHCGHVHYFNKNAIGDGQQRWREIDWTLAWDPKRKGWGFQFHSFNPFIPQFANGWVEFRDLYDDKDQMVRYKAQCARVPGRLVMPEAIGIQKLTQVNCVIYDDAFGPGRDYIIYFTRSAMVKAVRIRQNMKPRADESFEWEFDDGKMDIFRGRKEDPDAYALVKYMDKHFDTNKVTRLGIERVDGKEGQTYLKPFYMWDDVRTAIVPVDRYNKNGSVFIRKTIPQTFFEQSTGDVFTDTTTSYYAGAGDGFCHPNLGSNWSSIRSQASAENVNYTSAGGFDVGTYITGGNYLNVRLFFPADTSGITSGNVVSAASLNITGGDGSGANADTVTAHIVPTSQSSTSSLTGTDYQAYTNTSIGSLAFASWNGSGNNVINISNLTYVNTTGFSKIGIITSLDLNNTAPTGLNYQSERFSEATGTGSDPYISATYAAGGGGSSTSEFFKLF